MTRRVLLALLGVFFLSASIAPTGAAAADFQSVGLYQSVDEMIQWAGEFVAANSDIVQLVEFGRSYEDRPLLALKVSLDPGTNDPDKPEFLFTGGLHAREVIGSEAVYRVAEYLVAGYRAGTAAFLDILSEREVWLVPTMNPDGRVRVENGDSRHRKNAHHYSGQSTTNYTLGVDLNRNFPHRWEGASASPLSETFRGAAPLSELETYALWSMLHDPDYVSDLKAAIDFHSGMSSVLTPWISPSDQVADPLPPEDAAVFARLGGEIAGMTGYRLNDLEYDAFGSLTDSLYEEFETYAFCEELYAGQYTDMFTLFNPTDAAGLDAVIGKAIDSSMYLLSDDAFRIVPEPGTVGLFFSGLVLILPATRRGKKNRKLMGKLRKRLDVRSVHRGGRISRHARA